MKDLNRILHEGDPAAGDPGLSRPDVAAMRRAVVTATPPQPLHRAVWQQPLGVAAMVALTLAGGIVTGHRISPSERPVVPPETGVIPEGERRQLQFATPGGTRIIWVFDSEFVLEETTP